MVTAHSVTLSGLDPATQYYFLVESEDVSNNVGQLANAAYTFTTSPGPAIMNVSASTVSNNKVTVTWNTDVSADSTVFYATSSNLASPLTTTVGTLTKNHSVSIGGLVQGTTYYYYVRSIDGSSNTGVNKNVIAGVINYFTFNTTANQLPPTISSVATALIGSYGATVTWTTNSNSTSQVTYSTDAAFGTSSTTPEDPTLTTQHAVTLSDLASSTDISIR